MLECISSHLGMIKLGLKFHYFGYEGKVTYKNAQRFPSFMSFKCFQMFIAVIVWLLKGELKFDFGWQSSEINVRIRHQLLSSPSRTYIHILLREPLKENGFNWPCCCSRRPSTAWAHVQLKACRPRAPKMSLFWYINSFCNCCSRACDSSILMSKCAQLPGCLHKRMRERVLRLHCHS